MSFTIPILETIKTSQLQNGLRHGDYQRYRQYCARRLTRLRKSIKFVHGKGKQYIPKSITVENATEVGHVFVLLYNTERAWSYAMQLREDEKMDKEEHGEEECNSRIKFHLVGRLTKAAKWSRELLAIARETCDTRTILEVEAYAGYMNGNVALYREDWEQALQQFSTASRIYTELAKVGSLEEQDLLQQMLDEVSPYIRYCEYNLNLMGTSTSSMESIMALREESSNSLLASKLEQVLNEAAKKKAETMGEISWRGESIPVRNDELRVALLRPNDYVEKLSSVTSDEKREQLFLDIFRCYDNALRILNIEMDKYAQMKSGQLVDAEKNEIKRLGDYLRYHKLRQLVNRNLMIFKQLQSRLNEQGTRPRVGIIGHSTDTSQSTSPEELIHILDMILQNIEEMQCIPGTMDDLDENLECTARAATFGALRCYYISETYVANHQFAEALALYDRAINLAFTAEEYNEKRSDIGEQDQQCIFGLQEQLAGAKSRTIALGFLESSALQQDFAELSVSNTSSTLLQRLESFDAGAKNHQLVDIPPSMQAIPCKPLLFDIAYNQLEFPDLANNMLTEEQVAAQTTQASSTSSGFFGWLRGN